MNKLDKEVVQLCRALNDLDGVTTVESCCGHGKEPFHIWFTADNQSNVIPVCYFAACCHSGCSDWRVLVKTDCGMSPVTYLLEGPNGERGYKAADTIARCIDDYLMEGDGDG